MHKLNATVKISLCVLLGIMHYGDAFSALLKTMGIPHGSVEKCLTRNQAGPGFEPQGSSGVFHGCVPGQDSQPCNGETQERHE